MRLISRSAFGIFLAAMALQMICRPASAKPSSHSSGLESVKMPWLANLTENDLKKYNGLLKADTKIEHPTFSIIAPKGWSYSTSGPSITFSYEEALTLGDNNILINIFLDHRNRLGLEGWKKKFEISSLTDVTLGGKPFKMANAKAGRYYFYSSKNYELIVNVSSPDKPNQAQVSAEKSVLDSFAVN